jgi:hypothetical protein
MAAAPSETSEHRVAEFEPQILAHLSEGIAHPVGVVLCSDHRQFSAFVAVALEVGCGDPPEQAGEAAMHIGFLGPVARREQNLVHFGHGRGGHFLGPGYKCDPPATGIDEIQRGIQRGRAGGAGVLGSGRRDMGEFR